MRMTLMAGLAGVVALSMLMTGCKQDQPKRKYHEPIEGTALDINAETGEVSMELVDPGSGLAAPKKGYVSDKTEVQINGVTARLEDIQKGETVKVTGYSEGPRDSRKFMVTRISVQRSNNEWLDTSGAASAPAAGIESSGSREKAPAGR